MPVLPPEENLKRELSLLSLVLIIIGNTIGGGFFVLLAYGANKAGKLLPFSFLLGGFLALLIAIVYAEIATSFNQAGSSLAFTFSAHGKRVFPFILVWLVFLGDLSYGVINALGFGFYLHSLIPVPPTLLALGAIIAITFFNLKDVKKTGVLSALIAFSLVALLTAFGFLLARRTTFDFETDLELSPFSIFGILSGTAIIFTSFIGFEDVATLAEEIKNPQKNIPRALILTTIINTILFTVIAWIAVNNLPIQKLRTSRVPLLLMGESIGPLGKAIIFPAALLATLGSLMTAVLISSRNFYAISKQGFFPQFFQKVNDKGVPGHAVLFAGVFMALLVASGSVEFIAYLGNASYLLAIMDASLALMIMRKKRPYLKRPFRVPLFPYSPLIVAVLGLIVLSFVGANALLSVILWSAVGFLVYLSSLIDKKRIPWMITGILVFVLIMAVSALVIFLG